MAVVCALFLITNTMNALVAEQGSEIAILRALGGRRRQIASVILRTASALGAAGAVTGTALGIVVAYLLTRHLAAQIFSVQAGFAVSAPVVATSLLAGPLLAMLTSLPGLRRAVRRPVADVLDNRASLDYGTGRLDRILAGARLLSGPARMGVRNTLRRKRRTAATISQVAVAVARAIALFALGETVAAATAAVHARSHGPVFQYVMPGNCSRACSSWLTHSRGQPKARAAWPLRSAAAAPLVKWTYSPQFIRRV
jgi:putative ABC transport system permease protein